MAQRAKLIGAGILPSKPSKHHNVRTVYRGNTYDSLGEAECAWNLDLGIQAGTISDWERQISVAIADCPVCGSKDYAHCFNGTKPRGFHRDRVTCRIDFWVCPTEGSSYFLDFKGRLLPEFKLKVKFWALYVPHELRVTFKDGSEKVMTSGK